MVGFTGSLDIQRFVLADERGIIELEVLDRLRRKMHGWTHSYTPTSPGWKSPQTPRVLPKHPPL